MQHKAVSVVRMEMSGRQRIGARGGPLESRILDIDSDSNTAFDVGGAAAEVGIKAGITESTGCRDFGICVVLGAGEG